MDMFSLVLICVSLFFCIMMIRSMYMLVSGETRSPIGVFACMIGMCATLILLLNKETTLETFNVVRDTFVKSVESKSPLELAIWSLVLIALIILPGLQKIFK